jgi:hypothetical protein
MPGYDRQDVPVFGAPGYVRQVSMPSPTISTSPCTPRRTALPRQGPSIIFCGLTGALLWPSRARKVRWIAVGALSTPSAPFSVP